MDINISSAYFMTSSNGKNYTAEELEKIIDEVARNINITIESNFDYGEDGIDSKEFTEFLKKVSMQTNDTFEKNVGVVFDVLDVNNDGILTDEEYEMLTDKQDGTMDAYDIWNQLLNANANDITAAKKNIADKDMTENKVEEAVAGTETVNKAESNDNSDGDEILAILNEIKVLDELKETEELGKERLQLRQTLADELKNKYGITVGKLYQFDPTKGTLSEQIANYEKGAVWFNIEADEYWDLKTMELKLDQIKLIDENSISTAMKEVSNTKESENEPLEDTNTEESENEPLENTNTKVEETV